jgi:acetylornithine deacetylase/succinyl-diaminopimelate desuccinylase-like protein
MKMMLIGAALAVASSAAAQSAPDHAQAREMLDRVTGFRTAQGHGQMPAMAKYLADTLKAGGVAPDDIVMLPHGETTGMLVRVPGSDARARPILFSAHMDVVDARPEDWQRDPYKLVEENGYFFGRGVLDNKTGVVSLASTILRLRKEARRPRRTLVFAFVGDEETTFNTTRLIASISSRGRKRPTPPSISSPRIRAATAPDRAPTMRSTIWPKR